MDSRSSSKINCMFMPSLKHLALVKVASILWNQSDVRDTFKEIFPFADCIDEDKWQSLENEIVGKVPELQLPRKVGKLLISYIQPVGLQILDWIYYNVIQHTFVAITELPKEFFWTPQGTIDSKKVAETLINKKRITNRVRFEIACTYCLEQYITLLCKVLPRGCFKEHKDPIVRYWAYYVAGEIDQLLYRYSSQAGEAINFWQVGFEISLRTGNDAGTRYFLKRLTAENRAKIIVECISRTVPLLFRTLTVARISKNQFANNICYVLSEMNAEELKEHLSGKACHLLQWLLYWPWQSLFLRTAKTMWRFLSPEDYYGLLRAIRDKMFLGVKYFDYQNIFCEFWLEGSSAYQRHVITNKGITSLSPALFAVGCEESIKMLFKAATVLEKEEFIFSYDGQHTLHQLIKIGNQKLLKFFVEECISSKDVHELLQKFEKISRLLAPFFDVTKNEDFDMLEKFYQMLRAIEGENRKGCFEEVDN